MGRTLAVALFLTILVAAPASGQGKRWRVGAVPGSPVVVDAFGGKSDTRTKRVAYGIEYRNASERDVIAVQFLFVSFDVWDQILDVTRGLDLGEVAARRASLEEATFASKPRDLAAARYTSIVIPQKVRFEDGEIWEAPDAALREVLDALTGDLSDPDVGALDRLFDDASVTPDSVVEI